MSMREGESCEENGLPTQQVRGRARWLSSPTGKKKASILFLILALGPVPEEGDSGSGDEVQECSSPQMNLEKVRSGMDID